MLNFFRRLKYYRFVSLEGRVTCLDKAYSPKHFFQKSALNKYFMAKYPNESTLTELTLEEYEQYKRDFDEKCQEDKTVNIDEPGQYDQKVLDYHDGDIQD